MFVYPCGICPLWPLLHSPPPPLLVEPVGGGALRFPEGTVTETSIPVPVLNWQAAQPTVDGVSLLLSSSVFYWLTLVLV